jgi:GT2 family glycosyltransferase
MVFHLNRILPRYVARLLLPTGTPDLYVASHQVGWISGCCMLIKKDVYLNVGGLNEELEFYGEEPEFCMRLHKCGYQTWLVADATIKHLGGKSTTSSAASFLSVEESKLRRYTALQRHTVGIKISLVMSLIVLLSSYLKLIVSRGGTKDYFASAISHEKAVIAYMWKHM